MLRDSATFLPLSVCHAMFLSFRKLKLETLRIVSFLHACRLIMIQPNICQHIICPGLSLAFSSNFQGNKMVLVL